MKAVVTVMGIDRPGIIAKVSTSLFENGVNILDINQTIMQDIFTMVMLVKLGDDTDPAVVLADLDKIGSEIGVDIRMQNEEIFNSMHRI
ncbi:MAG: ACT domain-containing protein [Clostridia bacterium]|nr:ACT domain-containing protein [Clostridia bacterium]